MKRLLLLLISIFVIQITYSQVETRHFPDGNAFGQQKHIKEHPKANKTKTFPSFDAQKLLDEDELNKGLDIPFRFGKGFDTKVTLADGEWKNVEGGRLWSMEFRSEGAYSLNFVFDDFYLPDSAYMYAANTDGTMLYGPVTSKQNTKNGHFLTDLIQGDEVTLYLYEPDFQKGESELTIKRVVHAYKDLFTMSYGNLGGSNSCNIDINCYSSWDEESDAVALVLLPDGDELCSGSLLMTADKSFKPYFLSAFHCIDRYSPKGSLSSTEKSEAENWMFKFQYKMTSCGGSSATTGVTYNGADFKAAWQTTDFSLMEMASSPVGNTRFAWLGWDRSGDPPSSGTGIHHPSGDVMKISFDNDNLTTNSTSITWDDGTVSSTNTHWKVGFDAGGIERGSSGSPLFDQAKRVIGQLHGGNIGCSPITDYYGRFNLSWTGGGTDDTRLSNWLDPCNSGSTTTNTSRSPYISGPSNVCSSGATFTIDNFPSGATIDWDCNTTYLTEVGDDDETSYEVRSISSVSKGWVKATITTSCNDVITLKKDVWAGELDEDNIVCSRQGEAPGAWAQYHYLNKSGNTYAVAGYDTDGDGMNLDDENSFILGYGWRIVSSGWNWSATGGNVDNEEIKIYSSSSHSTGEIVRIGVRAKNACGWTDWQYNNWIVVSSSGSFSLSLSPNPSSEETSITLVSTSEETTVDEDEKWTLEVYNNQLLKTRNTNIKGEEYKINTTDWQEGIYIVRVIYKDEILTGKLLINR